MIFSSPPSTSSSSSNRVRNQLINSAFDFWQRGTSVTIANAASTYQADRWYVKNSLGTNGVITFSQVTGVTAGSIFGASVKITTAPTAAQVNGTELYQTLENPQSLYLYNQTVSFSCLVKALGNVNQVGIAFMYKTTEAKVDTVLGAETTFTVNSSTFTLGTLNSVAIGTTPTTSGVVGVRIRITAVSTGNTYDLNNGFIVEQTMMNLGTAVGTFQRAGATPQQELQMCQRFYEKSYAPATNPGTATTAGMLMVTSANAANRNFFVLAFKATHRANGTLVGYSPNSGASGMGYDVDAAADFTASTSAAGVSYSNLFYAGTPAINHQIEVQYTVDADI